MSARWYREEACLKQWGCTVAQWRELDAVGRSMLAEGCSKHATPTGAFASQRRNAKSRGCGMTLTLWEWWTIWQDSGKWDQRGRGSGYVMCRVGDSGPYALGNVFIGTAEQNVSDGNRKYDLPLGVHRNTLCTRNPYIALRRVGGKSLYIGSFPSPELAHAAYLMAGAA